LKIRVIAPTVRQKIQFALKNKKRIRKGLQNKLSRCGEIEIRPKRRSGDQIYALNALICLFLLELRPRTPFWLTPITGNTPIPGGR